MQFDWAQSPVEPAKSKKGRTACQRPTSSTQSGPRWGKRRAARNGPLLFYLSERLVSVVQKTLLILPIRAILPISVLNKEPPLTLRRIFNCILLGCAMVCTTAAQSDAAPVFSDFSFGGGTPFGGSTSLSGVTVLLVSTNTQPYTSTSFRDDLTSNPATVTMTFSTPVSEFHLDVIFVRSDEFLTGFNIGAPNILTGTLVNNGGLITTSLPFPNDSGMGTLSWTNLSATTISFTVGGPAGGALAMEQFGIGVPAVPALAPFSIVMLLGVMGAAGYRKLNG